LKRFTIPVGLAICGLMLLFPVIFSNPAVTTVATFTLLFAVAATGWDIFSGYTGYLSLGHAAYYGLGAYFFALFCQIWNVPGGWLPFLLVPVVGLMTAFVALPVGWLTLKSRRYHFLMLTLVLFAFSAQIPTLLDGTPLGGAEVSLPVPSWSAETFNAPFYYVALVLLAVVLFLSWWIRSSKYGLVLLAIRDDEDRVLGLGVRTDLYKLSALLISALLVSIVGAVNAYFLGVVAPPSAFDPRLNIVLPLLALFGGAGTPLGPALGALVLVPLQQNLTVQFGQQGWDLILYGAVFLLVLLVLPGGVLPALQKNVPMWAKMINARLPVHELRAISSPVEVTASPLLDFSGVERASDETSIAGPRSPSVEARARVIPPRPGPGIPSVSLHAFQPTSKLRAIHLVEGGQQTKPSPEILTRSPLSLSTSSQGRAPVRRSAQMTGGSCPRCQAPLRVVDTMVFCRRCGLIVSKHV
jgi:branched-chain amino acid transport system permease protein